MSTVEVKMFTLVCDGCGADVNEGTDYSAWSDTQGSLDIAVDNGWLDTGDGKDWCPDCIEWNEDETYQRPTALLALRAPLHKERA